jgi:hypothetical protein
LLKVKKHIARILFGIIFLPIVFQSVHIAWHHSHGHLPGNHHYCYTTTINKDFLKDSLTLNQETNHCLICEYIFSIKNLPVFSIFEAIIPIVAGVFIATETKQSHRQISALKPPRAPPFQTLALYFSL